MSRLWASLRRAFGRRAGPADPQPSAGALLPPAALPADVDEKAWLACTDPQTMLVFLRGRSADRKLLLFTVADCRLFAGTIPGEGGLAVEVAERHADGLATRAEVKA